MHGMLRRLDGLFPAIRRPYFLKFRRLYLQGVLTPGESEHHLAEHICPQPAEKKNQHIPKDKFKRPFPQRVTFLR